MHTLRKFSRGLCAVLALCVASLGVPATAQAALLATPDAVAQAQAAIDRAQLNAALDRADVQQQLTGLGVDVPQAKARIAAMTDEEIAALNGKLKELPAGGDDLLGVALLVFIILLITDIAGYTHLFPFVNHGHR